MGGNNGSKAKAPEKTEEELRKEVEIVFRLYYTDLSKPNEDIHDEPHVQDDRCLEGHQEKADKDHRDALREACDKMYPRQSAEQSLSSVIDKGRPFLFSNMVYMQSLLHEKWRQYTQDVELNAPGGSWTIDSWNESLIQGYSTTYSKLLQDSELDPHFIYLSLFGVEYSLCGSAAENVVTTFIGHDKHGGADIDIMMSMPLTGKLKDLADRPGYTRIQLSSDDLWAKNEESFMLSRNFISSMLHLSHNDMQGNSQTGKKSYTDLSGPAISEYSDSSFQSKEQDFVSAFYDQEEWPDIAMEWISRKRLSGWPSISLVERAVSHGTYVVPVSHPLSKDPSIEWRYSFSKPEINLMHSINGRQRKCFMITKRLCNLTFSGFKLFSSYHVKTAFFWMMEETPAKFWTSASMDNLVNLLLDNLICHFSNHNLPNYFIRQANIIDHLPRDHIKTVTQKLLKLQFRDLSLPKYIRGDFCLSHIHLAVEPCQRHYFDFETLLAMITQDERNTNSNKHITGEQHGGNGQGFVQGTENCPNCCIM